MSEPIIVMLDASAIKHSACLLHLWNIIYEGYRNNTNSINIEYGSAWHVFKETYLKTGDKMKAITDAQIKFTSAKITEGKFYKWLTVGHLTLTCMQYLKHYEGIVNKSYGEFELVQRPDGEGSMIEVTFAHEYYRSKNLVIILAGTIDEVVKLPSKVYALGDDKTSSKPDHEAHLNSFSSSHQLRFYHFAVKWWGEKYPDSIWNEIGSKLLGCYINGVYLADNKDTKFKRSRIFQYSDEEQAEFKWSIDKLVVRIQEFVDSGRGRPMREGFANGACEDYCPYLGSCLAISEGARENILERNFVKNKYNPLLFRK